MEYSGHIKNGVVVLDAAPSLPDGTRVRVVPVVGENVKQPSLNQKLLKLAGKAKGLPRDMARNHDHYLHGLPKR
jgi:hypothetical protein